MAHRIIVVDEDPVWQKPVDPAEEENDDDSADETKPQIDEDIEVKQMKRLEQLRSSRPFHSIPEEGRGGVSVSPPRKLKQQSIPIDSKERRKGGLISAQDTSQEVAKTTEDELMRFHAMDPSLTGKGAEPVYRDKLTGRRLSKEDMLKSREEEKPKEKKLEWGKGLAQKREAEERLRELELEKDGPFARTRDDPELDRMLRDRVRWGDPMAHLVKRESPEPALMDLGDNEKMMESGFIIPQEIPSDSWIKRRCAPAANRYGIRPGRHWDGVDRSNGYENQLLKGMNEKRATESDM